MSLLRWPGEDGPVREGAEFGTFGTGPHRVFLVGGGHFDAHTAWYSRRPEYIHFLDGFLPEPYRSHDSAVIDAAAVKRIKAVGEALDPLWDEPPFRRVAGGLRCWRLGLRNGYQLLVMAHRCQQSWRRIVLNLDTVGGREPSTLPVVSILRGCVRSIEDESASTISRL